MSPAKVGNLIKADESVRSAVNEDDGKLLRLLIFLQHILTGLVLLVSASLIACSIWLLTRPQPLSVIVKPPLSNDAQTENLLVDLFPVKVEWTSSGLDEKVSVYLENVEGGRRTPKKSVSSDVRGVVFQGDEVVQAAMLRGYKQQNEIRAVVEWRNGSSRSEPKAMTVGITVALNLFGKLIEHGEERPEPFHTLFALIDQSTSALPADYRFNGDLVGMMKTGKPFVMPLSSSNDDGSVTIRDPDKIDWFKPLSFVYSGPDDPRIVKTIVSGRPERL